MRIDRPREDSTKITTKKDMKYSHRFKEETKECGHDVCGCNITGHTAAEEKWINKMCVYVCVIAFVIMFASYILLPEGDMNSTLPNWVNILR